MTKKLLLVILVILAMLVPAFATGPAKSAIVDTLYAPDGSLMSGKLRITNKTFTSADGFVIPAGTLNITITNGALNLLLVPTVGSTPSGESYKVEYFLGVPYSAETWIVPAVNTNLAGVRTGVTPTPNVMIAMSQMVPPQPCTDGEVPTWQTGTSTWLCRAFAAPGAATLVMLSPVVTDTNKIQIQAPFAATLTKIACSTDIGTVDVNFDIREQTTPGTAGTNTMASSLTCTNTRASTTTFSSSSVSLSEVLNLQMLSVGGGVGVVRIYLYYTPQ